jgi:hypothetical protein
MRRRAEHRIGDTGPEKPLKLRIAAQFFDAEIERRTVAIPVRPSIAAAVEPARPPRMIAMSVYFIENSEPKPPSLRPERVKKA